MAGERNLLHDVISGCVAGVAATLAVSGSAVVFQDQIGRYISELHPTCVQPTGLIEIPPETMTATGPAHEDDEGDKPPSEVLDSYLGSLWVPPLQKESWSRHRAVYSSKPEDRTLTLQLPEGVDVQLVCVNNGLAYSATAYRNFGRARTVRTWVGASDDPVVTTLASQSSDEMQQLQEVGRDLGEVTELHIRVDDAYPGETVETFDPNACGQASEEIAVGREVVQLRYERGCIAVASPYAGLSDVVLYRASD